MKFDLKGKIAIVTGGGSGIGRAISITLAEQGTKVHIFELKEAAALEVVKEIESGGGRAVAHECNVAVQKEINEEVSSIGKKEGLTFSSIMRA